MSSLNSSNFLLIYNLPVYFQAIANASPMGSGIRNLPLMLASCNPIPYTTLENELTDRKTQRSALSLAEASSNTPRVVFSSS